MKTRKSLIVTSVTLLLSIAVFATVMFAWFAQSNTTSDFILQTGVIDTEVAFYRGVRSVTPDGNPAYTWNTIETTNDADRIFENVIPGQIVTLRLDITNTDRSNVDINFVVRFGSIFVGAYSDGNYTYTTEVTESPASEPQHFFHAINFVVEEVPIPDGTSAPADTTVAAVQIADTGTFEPVEGTKTLADYVADKTVVSKTGPASYLGINETVSYIIKIYFDPTYGDPNSNEFQHNAFRVEHIIVDATQVHKITE